MLVCTYTRQDPGGKKGDRGDRGHACSNETRQDKGDNYIRQETSSNLNTSTKTIRL